MSTDNPHFKLEEIAEVLERVHQAIQWGIIPKSSSVFIEPTTTSSLVFCGRPPRKDVYQKLEKIASILKKQSLLFPHFELKQIRGFSKVILGNADSRTIKNYRDCIVKASEKNTRNVTVDVTQFCSEFESGV